MKYLTLLFLFSTIVIANNDRNVTHPACLLAFDGLNAMCLDLGGLYADQDEIDIACIDSDGQLQTACFQRYNGVNSFGTCRTSDEDGVMQTRYYFEGVSSREVREYCLSQSSGTWIVD